MTIDGRTAALGLGSAALAAVAIWLAQDEKKPAAPPPSNLPPDVFPGFIPLPGALPPDVKWVSTKLPPFPATPWPVLPGYGTAGLGQVREPWMNHVYAIPWGTTVYRRVPSEDGGTHDEAIPLAELYAPPGYSLLPVLPDGTVPPEYDATRIAFDHLLSSASVLNEWWLCSNDNVAQGAPSSRAWLERWVNAGYLVMVWFSNVCPFSPGNPLRQLIAVSPEGFAQAANIPGLYIVAMPYFLPSTRDVWNGYLGLIGPVG